MHATVEETQWLTPSLVRVVLGGPGLVDFDPPHDTDAYVNLAFAPPGAPYGPVFDPQAAKEAHPRDWWPVRRRYTVRSWNPVERTLAIDFVVHGDAGVAGPWAAAAKPGDVLVFTGPAGGYRPDAEADWHLLVGDESALPAIAASLEVLEPGSRAVVRLVSDTPEHVVPLTTQADLDLRWLHRAGAADPTAVLLDDVSSMTVPAGRAHVFVHGEADEIRALRRHLLADRGLPRAEMSCSPYWRRDMTDEDWRAVKRDYVAAMEADT